MEINSNQYPGIEWSTVLHVLHMYASLNKEPKAEKGISTDSMDPPREHSIRGKSQSNVTIRG